MPRGVGGERLFRPVGSTGNSSAEKWSAEVQRAAAGSMWGRSDDGQCERRGSCGWVGWSGPVSGGLGSSARKAHDWEASAQTPFRRGCRRSAAAFVPGFCVSAQQMCRPVKRAWPAAQCMCGQRGGLCGAWPLWLGCSVQVGASGGRSRAESEVWVVE